MIRRLATSRFISNLSTLVSGKVAAALVTFVGTPIIARLFNPDDFGVATLFVTIVTLIGGVAGLNYHSAILLSMSERRSRMLRRLSLLILTVVTLSWYALMVFVAWSPAELPLANAFGAWVWAMPLAAWVTGANLIGRNVLARAKFYKLVSLADVGQAAGTVSSRLGMGFLFGSTAWGLITGRLLGLFTQLVLIWSSVIQLPQIYRYRMTVARLQAVAGEYRDFPLFNMPANLLSAVSIKLPILVMGPWLGMDVVGFYAIAQRLIGMPLNLVANSFRLVLLQKASDVKERGNSLTGLYVKALIGLAASGALPFGLLWAFGGWGLVWFLGENWAEAGRYVEILVPWYFATWVGALVPPFMVSLRKQGVWLGLQVLLMIGRVAAFGYCYSIDASVETVLQTFVWTNVALIAIMVSVGYIETRKSAVVPAESDNADESDQTEDY
jgi:O-antigen/teichoic acid export membrane protein